MTNATTNQLKWHKTEKHGGVECFGSATSQCGNWQIVRELYMPGGYRDRYHWFIEYRMDRRESSAVIGSYRDERGWYEWATLGGIGYDCQHHRNLRDAKAATQTAADQKKKKARPWFPGD